MPRVNKPSVLETTQTFWPSGMCHPGGVQMPPHTSGVGSGKLSTNQDEDREMLVFPSAQQQLKVPGFVSPGRVCVSWTC